MSLLGLLLCSNCDVIVDVNIGDKILFLDDLRGGGRGGCFLGRATGMGCDSRGTGSS